ncbi:ROK family protein [Chitinimonas sp. BJYL2]|uniref:ROK family protein n=1 Tax=Chitinimonas sp. BJYL2 TaxID=2976696 RepID=UPI0022B5D13B|nr:ROK family protein [Chitinimonas sp. BJYL2]
MNRVCLAADLGGTKIRTALIDDTGRELLGDTTPTQASAGGARVLDNLVAALTDLHARAGAPELAGIGISSAGVIDRHTGVVLDATNAIPGWAGTRIGDTLHHRFGLPVTVENDVHAALRGELWRGAAAGCEQVAMLTLGTGLGGALAIGGDIVTGSSHLAGHFGRQQIWSRHGGWMTLESLLSGTGLQRLHHLHGGQGESGEAVIAAVQAGEGAAMQALEEWLDLLAAQITNLHWTYNPARIVLGGGLIRVDWVWWPGLSLRLKADGIPVNVVPAKLGNDAGVIGAACRLWAHLESPSCA